MPEPDALAAWIAAPRDDLCLDFVNTRYWRGSPRPTETLNAPADLLAWAGGVAAGPAIAAAAAALLQTQPERAAKEFTAVLALREALYGIFGAADAGSDASANATFEAALARAPARHALAWDGPRRVWQVLRWRPGLAGLLTPVLWSAADLLAGSRNARVRLCANPQCRWVFLDDSKGGNRRWCAMSACGNRAKAQRHYARQKAL